MAEQIIPILVEDEMKTSFIDYSMSVIVSRALPDVRDGLKPVHRRILYAMNEMGMFHNKPYKKSARIVGEVLGKYHPHGDTAVYDSMVRMAQPFSLRYPLIDGQGNFGSVDGDSAAAMRYTEARLDKKAEELLQDLNKNTVDFRPNFDGSLKEPVVLPSKFPNLLLNGASGIAVGMATNIPPHNITEVLNGVMHVIENPDCEIIDLMNIITGPDFPTGASILGNQGIYKAYTTGKGSVKIRSKYHFEKLKERDVIVVDEIPYMVNKSRFIEQIADQVKDKHIVGIADLRDESDRQGMRIVIICKQSANKDFVVNQLFKKTWMQTSFGINFLALVNNRPITLNLKQMLRYFIDHRKEIIIRRTQFDLDKAEQRAHILEGLITALDHIDEVIRKIKQSSDASHAQDVLMQDYSLSESQAKAILDMKLQKLASLEQKKIKDEHSDLQITIEELKAILASDLRILQIIKEESQELIDKFGDKRRTSIEEGDFDDIDMEDLIKEEDVAVTISHDGYMKRIPLDTYKTQGRGGKGVIGAKTKDEDFVEHIFTSSTHSFILFFTDKGKVYWLKVYQIPEGSRTSKGKNVINLVNLEPGENISAMVPIKEFDKTKYLFFATKKGVAKKTSLELYSKPRKGGIIAISLRENDELINVELTSGNDNILIATKKGMAVRFNEKNVRPMGRSASGVRGITLKPGDEVIGMQISDENKDLLTLTENGFGKRTPTTEYRLISRGGKGVTNIKTTDRNGGVVSIKTVNEDDGLILISKEGQIIRVNVSSISRIGRATQGVRVMRLSEGDKLISTAKIIAGETDNSIPEAEIPEPEQKDLDSQDKDLEDESKETTEETPLIENKEKPQIEHESNSNNE